MTFFCALSETHSFWGFFGCGLAFYFINYYIFLKHEVRILVGKQLYHSAQRKEGIFPGGRRWMKGEMSLIYSVIWSHGIVIRGSTALKEAPPQEHEWKPLAIADLEWIKYGILIFHSLVGAHNSASSAGAERSRGVEGGGLLTGGFLASLGSSHIIQINHRTRPQKRAAANCFNGFPLR